MAQVLVNLRTGRVVTVQPDVHRWGRMESKQAWLSAGGLNEDWPGDFVVLRVPGRPVPALGDLVGRGVDLSLLQPGTAVVLADDGEIDLEPWELDLVLL